MLRENPLTTLPTEMWTLVCNSVTSPSCQTTLMQSCSYFNQLQADIIPTSLFPKLLLEVMRYLNRENLFLLRRICRSWRTIIDEMLENAIKRVGNQGFGIRFIPTMELTVNYKKDLGGTRSLIPEDLSRYLETTVNPLLGKSLNVKVIFRYAAGMDTLFLEHLRAHGKHVLELKLFMRRCNTQAMVFQMWQYLQLLPNLRKLSFNGAMCTCVYEDVPPYDRQQLCLPFLEEVNIATMSNIPIMKNLNFGHVSTGAEGEFTKMFRFNFTNIKRFQTSWVDLEFSQTRFNSLNSLTELCISNPNTNRKIEDLSPNFNALNRLTIRWSYNNNYPTVPRLLGTSRFKETLNFLHIYFEYFQYSDICVAPEVTLRLPNLHTWKFTNCSLHKNFIHGGGMDHLTSLHKIQIVQEDAEAASLLSLASKELLGSEESLLNVWSHSTSLEVVTFENCGRENSHQWKFWSRDLHEFHNH